MSSFKSIENILDVYRVKDSMEKFCESLREHATEIINFKKKLPTKEQRESYENKKICYICKEKFEHKHPKDKQNF